MSESDWSCGDEDTEENVMNIPNTYLLQRISSPYYVSRCTQRRQGLILGTNATHVSVCHDEGSTRTRARPSVMQASGESANKAMSRRAASSSATPLPPARRGKVRDVLKDALRLCAASHCATTEQRPLSPLVDAILASISKSDDRAYTASAVLRGLTDPLNEQLRRDVLHGVISPGQLVALDDESLLNPGMRAKCQMDRAQRQEQQTVEFQQRLTSTVTSMFTCPSCGNKECYANFRSTDFVKWQGDDPTPTLLRCVKCQHSFKA